MGVGIPGDNRFSERSIAHLVYYVERHKLSIIPVGSDKRPLIQWKVFQTRRPTLDEMLSWPTGNLAVVTGAISGIVIVDMESREDAVWFHNQKGSTPVVVKTRRGFHFWFRHPGGTVLNGQKIEGKYDVRGDGGYALLPPSVFKAADGSIGCYEWASQNQDDLRLDALPLYRTEWNAKQEEDATPAPEGPEIIDGRKYIAHIYAVSGQNGHNATWRAVNKLALSGMSEAEALYALLDWNKTNASPPWSERELVHKIRDAYNKRRGGQ